MENKKQALLGTIKSILEQGWFFVGQEEMVLQKASLLDEESLENIAQIFVESAEKIDLELLQVRQAALGIENEYLKEYLQKLDTVSR